MQGHELALAIKEYTDATRWRWYHKVILMMVNWLEKRGQRHD